MDKACVAQMEDTRHARSVLVWISQRKRPLGRARRRRKDNIDMDLQEVGWV